MCWGASPIELLGSGPTQQQLGSAQPCTSTLEPKRVLASAQEPWQQCEGRVCAVSASAVELTQAHCICPLEGAGLCPLSHHHFPSEMLTGAEMEANGSQASFGSYRCLPRPTAVQLSGSFVPPRLHYQPLPISSSGILPSELEKLAYSVLCGRISPNRPLD